MSVRRLAVALHDVEPATYERCALIRDWLDDHGVERCTLLVIPAADLHPFYQRRPQLAAWLLDCADRGDAIAQHGLQHRRTRPHGRLRRPVASWPGGRDAEFPGLDPDATAASVDAGLRMLARAGLEPRGFVAPGYAYTAALRRTVRDRFDWWSTLLAVRSRDGSGGRAPALGLGTGSYGGRVCSAAVVRAGGVMAGPLLRLDLHPADFDHPGHVRAVEWVLRRAADRRAVTYEELV